MAQHFHLLFQMSKALFGKEFTTHSIRRSAARWAARCGADDSSIKRAGRWYVISCFLFVTQYCLNMKYFYLNKLSVLFTVQLTLYIYINIYTSLYTCISCFIGLLLNVETVKQSKSSVAFNFRKSNSFELYTQDARAEMIKEHHDGQPVSDHKIWIFKPLR